MYNACEAESTISKGNCLKLSTKNNNGKDNYIFLEHVYVLTYMCTCTHKFSAAAKIGDSPPSLVNYWIQELKLDHLDKKILMEGSKLTDNHMDGSASLLAIQFPDMPPPQTGLRAKRPRLLQPAKESSIFFHNYDEHWVLSHFREGVVYTVLIQLISPQGDSP